MPCSDGPREGIYEVRQEAQKEIAAIESLLCSACTALDEIGNYNFALNPRLDEWWSRHKKSDRERQLREAKQHLLHQKAIEIAKLPFNQLTPQQLSVLKKAGMLS